MDVIGQIVKDIIDLKYESKNIQQDATMENMYEWYYWAFMIGIIEVIYKYGELQGFIEWVRLDNIPKTRDEVVETVDFNKSEKGDVLYIANCCVRDDNERHGTLWRLVHMVRDKNKDFEYVVWHDGDDKELRVYKNKESQLVGKEGGVSK